MPGKKRKFSLPEMLLRMAQLHVEKGRERIARQKRVIADLERDGRDVSLPKAHDVLVFLRSVQAMVEADLALKRRTAREGWSRPISHRALSDQDVCWYGCCVMPRRRAAALGPAAT